MQPTVRELFEQHDGYISDKWSSYLDVYDEVFKPYRFLPVRILEIGVQNGGSLQIWSKYFPNATVIVGCDIDRRIENLDPGEKIKLLVGDISSSTTVERLKLISPAFDIIIDDGSHRSEHIIAAFDRLFPLISPGGCFLAEDLCCSYWRSHKGRVLGSFSSIEYLKRLVDAINLDHWAGRWKLKLLASLLSPISYRKLKQMSLGDLHDQIRSLKFYNSICVIEKAKGQTGIGPRVSTGTVALVDDAVIRASNIRYGGT
jgi:23S rRNA U2552 (ribose-2'-O)-methylase RlmE/FtsJ